MATFDVDSKSLTQKITTGSCARSLLHHVAYVDHCAGYAKKRQVYKIQRVEKFDIQVDLAPVPIATQATRVALSGVS